MRPKSGLPKRKSIRSMPEFSYGLRENPCTQHRLHPSLRGGTISNRDKISAVSFFAGCGGLDLGVLGGFDFLGNHYAPLPFVIERAYDNDQKSVETYRLNIGDEIEHIDLTKIDMKNVPAADVLFGGFPCQDFSSCGHKRGFEGTRGRLYQVLSDYMRIHRPALVVGENVPLLAGMHNGALLDEIVRDFTAEGYRVKVWMLNCPDYGLPQSRRRLIIMCTRNDLPFEPKQPPPTHVLRHVTIDEAIDDLKNINDESIPNQSQYFVATRPCGRIWAR